MSLKFALPLVLSALTLAACSPVTAPTVTPTQAPTAPAEANQESNLLPPTDASTSDTLKVYSLDEVAKHDSPQDCWLAIHGKVYNVSGFAVTHPGGEAVYQGCGKDATTLFETRPMGDKTPHSQKARALLPNFYIGELAQ